MNEKPASNVTRLRPTVPCPLCKSNSVQDFYPFCSVRCANVDLNRWLTGAYVIPGARDETMDGKGEQGREDENDHALPGKLPPGPADS